MLNQVALPVVVFTALILALTVLVLAARRKLEPSGVVLLEINAGRSLEVAAGSKLLDALAAHGIYLPAACGGRGTCGQCRVVVTAGGGLLLPTEELHIDPAEAAAGTRLACMLKIRESLAIRLAEDVLAVRRTSAVVESNRSVSTYLKELVLRPEMPVEFEAGDYVLVEAPPHRVEFADFAIDAPYRERWAENNFFELKSIVREATTRAYSLANPPQQADRLVLVVRIALPAPTAPSGTPPGRVSSYIFGLKPGDRVDLRGPYGDFHVQESDREMIFIGGGAGIAPLRSMILDQLARQTGRRISFWYGARDRDDLCYVEEFEAAAAAHDAFDYRVALSSVEPNSDWPGYRGLIHAVVHENYLAQHASPASAEYYLCGPPLMSAAVLQMLEGVGVPRENIFFDDFGD